MVSQVASKSPDQQELLETVPCPFCRSEESEAETGPICDGASHDLAEPVRSMAFHMDRCLGCGLVYQRERLKREHLGALYSLDDYMCYKSFDERGAVIRSLAKISAKKLVAQIEKHRPPDNNLVVDFGCGNGSWLELFRSCGVSWDLQGTEIDEAMADHVRGLGFACHVSDDTNLGDHYEDGSVGVIYMHHVIEHVPQPAAFLKNLRKVLAPGGLIVGQTPDAGCLERRIFGDDWNQWHLPHHLVIFDMDTMAAHAAEADLEVVDLRGSPSGATQWSMSWLKRRARKKGRMYRWNQEPLHRFLTLLFTPVALVQARLGSTSHLDFLLKRPPEST